MQRFRTRNECTHTLSIAFSDEKEENDYIYYIQGQFLLIYVYLFFYYYYFFIIIFFLF